jgi:hypothetical protein
MESTRHHGSHKSDAAPDRDRSFKAWAQKMDRRRVRRVRIKLDGKLFFPNLARESDCFVIDLSSGGAGIKSKQLPPSQTKVVLYVNGFGRFEGVTAQPINGGGRILFDCPPKKRQRIDQQLTWFVKEGGKTESMLRESPRVPYVEITNFVRLNGDVIACTILDISLTGVSLETEDRPPIDEYVRIGRMVGRVTRHHRSGIGVAFLGDQRIQESPA